MSHLLHIPTGSDFLPPVGSAAFNELILRSTEQLRRRQPVADDPVPVDVQRERDMADVGLSEHNRMLKAFERSTKR